MTTSTGAVRSTCTSRSRRGVAWAESSSRSAAAAMVAKLPGHLGARPQFYRVSGQLAKLHRACASKPIFGRRRLLEAEVILDVGDSITWSDAIALTARVVCSYA